MDADIIDLDAFNHEQLRLHSLMDDDPAKAIKEARLLPCDTPVKGILYTSLKASVLIDAGSSARNKQAIEEGIDLFRRLIAELPDEAGFHYNLANGLMALADQQPYAGSSWYMDTASIRSEARSHLQKAISSKDNAPIISTAFANLGNALIRSHRWVEAYDAYTNALGYDRSNAIASTGAAKVLLRCSDRGIGNRRILLSVAARHLKAASLHPGRIAELAGKRAQDELAPLLQMQLPESNPPDLTGASDYEKFVARHRLALSPTIEGLDCSLKRWDCLRFDSITEPVGTSGVPPLFAMLNVMKSDFLAARYLAHQALTAEFPDSGLYTDTLDYAVYGIVPSLLSLAQRACIDVLDKIAAATTEYFCIPGNVRVVYFWSRWFDNPREGPPFVWHSSLRPHIDKGNTAIVALADISFDIDEGGFLMRKKAFRHSSTHRFTVLHDMGCTPSRASAQIEHSEIHEFKEQLIESLQLARAAILYFVEMVTIAEKTHAAGAGKVGTIAVPSHHYIRGEEDGKDGQKK
jgi:tetratricopeptide (TPR) repeat protein